MNPFQGVGQCVLYSRFSSLLERRETRHYAQHQSILVGLCSKPEEWINTNQSCAAGFQACLKEGKQDTINDDWAMLNMRSVTYNN